MVRIMKLRLKRFWSWTRSIFMLAKMRAKNDAEELLKSLSEWRNTQKKAKPVNVWILAFITILILPAVLLGLPMSLGVIGIVFQKVTLDTVAVVSQEALIGLILVATALGALTLWFAAASTDSSKRIIKYIGKCFLFAALALSVFMLLSPILPDIKLNTDSYSIFLKYTAVIFLMAGGVSFAWATLVGLFYLWRL